MENFELEDKWQLQQDQLAKDIKEYLEQNSPDSILWDNCDDALIGTSRLFRQGEWREVAMYDYEMLINIFIREFREDGKSEQEVEDEAVEWVDYNIVGAYVGPYTPHVLYSSSIVNFE